jgi:Ca2+-binding EF-hand superfamily protein
MNRRRLLLALLGVAAAPAGYAAQKSATPKPDINALAAEKVKELLLLMDTNKNGKISRQEWMNFMAAEFDRLDKDKSGELDPKELSASWITIRPPAQGK